MTKANEEEEEMDSSTMQDAWAPGRLGDHQLDSCTGRSRRTTDRQSPLPPVTDWRGTDESSERLKQQRR